MSKQITCLYRNKTPYDLAQENNTFPYTLFSCSKSRGILFWLTNKNLSNKVFASSFHSASQSTHPVTFVFEGIRTMLRKVKTRDTNTILASSSAAANVSKQNQYRTNLQPFKTMPRRHTNNIQWERSFWCISRKDRNVPASIAFDDILRVLWELEDIRFWNTQEYCLYQFLLHVLRLLRRQMIHSIQQIILLRSISYQFRRCWLLLFLRKRIFLFAIVLPFVVQRID